MYSMGLYQMIFISVCFGFLVKSILCDTFTSMVHLQEVIQAEQDLTSYIQEYIDSERDRIQSLERYVEELTSHHQVLSQGDPERHLSNPVNAFLVTSHMYNLMSQVNDSITIQSASNIEAYHNASERTRSSLPSKDDMDGAVLALLRIQDTYNLSTQQLADSNLGLTHKELEAPPLSGEDCFNIARTAFLMDDFYHAVWWFKAALRKFDESKEVLFEKVTSTLEYLNFSLYKQGNLELAIATAQRWVDMEPGAEPGTTNLAVYHNELDNAGRVYRPNHLPPLNNVQTRAGFSASTPFRVYESLCQGKQLPEFQERARLLRCRYGVMLHSYYPSLEEELSLEPRLVFFHRVVTDREIQHIKELAKPKLNRSGVFASNAATPAGGIKTHTRVSKSAWIEDGEDEVISSLSRKISRITGLTINYAEPVEVENYGIGGHYEPHCDFARENNPDVFEKGAGNRIATFILYLTDVEQGGATVFPHLGATVWPEKGGAAFWYNLKKQGSLDERTLHGACPVLVGYKWVCNKWFHESMNEFTRPCPLKLHDVV